MTSPDSTQSDHQDDTAVTDILSSVRRILHDDSAAGQSQETDETSDMSSQEEELTLDNSMMVTPPAPLKDTETASPSPVSASTITSPADEAGKSKDDLMNAQTVAAAERSLDELHAAFSGTTPLASDTVISRSSGLTIEDMVRGEVRSMVRTWLDAHLPSLVEILVRAEIARLRPRE